MTNTSRKNRRLPGRFDPFSDRMSRDIRNELSESLLRALKMKDPAPFLQAAQKWLSKKPAPIYTRYIADRTARYNRVFTQIQEQAVKGIVGMAVIVWNQRLFFEVHELLETLWKTKSGGHRDAIKGLIQAAGVWVQLERGEKTAASRLSLKARNLIQQHRRHLAEIENLDELLDKLVRLDNVPPELLLTPPGRGETAP